MDPEAAKAYLRSLLNRPLHIYTTDNRMFVGEFKCTDNDLNIILAQTHEYRLPPPPSAADFLAPGLAAEGRAASVMTPRYVGLIVVPGKHIVKIEAGGRGEAGGGQGRESRVAEGKEWKEAAVEEGREGVREDRGKDEDEDEDGSASASEDVGE